MKKQLSIFLTAISMLSTSAFSMSASEFEEAVIEQSEAAPVGTTVLYEIVDENECDDERKPCVRISAGAYLGNTMGVNLMIRPTGFLVIDAGFQGRMLPRTEADERFDVLPDDSVNSGMYGGFTSAVRLVAFRGVVEAGGRYQAFNVKRMPDEFKNSFSHLGWDAQINFYQDKDLKAYVGVSGMNPTATPDQFRVGLSFRIK